MYQKKQKNTHITKLLVSLLGPPFCTQQDIMDLINNIDIFDRREPGELISWCFKVPEERGKNMFSAEAINII